MRIIASFVAAFLLADSAVAAERGLDQPRLQRLERLVTADVQKGRIPGVVMLVMRDGKVVMNKAIGSQDPARVR